MKNLSLSFILLLAFCAGSVYGSVSETTSDTLHQEDGSGRYFNIIHLIQQKVATGSVVKVAVVDDGFRLTHKTLKEFIFTNEKEIASNYQDDDLNGFTDDLYGWDISDNDADVSVPAGREELFYHGTYVAGIVTAVFQRYYGENANKYLRIIPVKVLSDHARKTYLTDGYKGIQYASAMGADIICCAWSGGVMADAEKAIVDAAIARGALIIGAAGNFYSEKADLPSAYPGVLCVASVDSLLHKSRFSNYGMRIDLAAPGDSVFGAHPIADNAFIKDNGTSAATAMIAGCAAILKSINAKATAGEIADALENTATPLDSLNLKWCGKLGAGLPDMARATEYISHQDYRFAAHSPGRPKGKIFYRKKCAATAWEIHPAGVYKGIHLEVKSMDIKKNIRIFSADSLWYEGPLEHFSRPGFIPGSRFTVVLDQGKGLPKEFELGYYMETIDSTTLYCRDTRYLSQEEGTISDGSGALAYANDCSCKWLITVPANKRIRVEFSALDTQPNVDYIWIFAGNGTLQENLLAKFSGTNLPPVITSPGNELLLWFLSDGNMTGKGWTLQYKAVDQ